jgi:hypothetical protein
MDALPTVKEVIAILKVHPNSVYEKAKNGEMMFVHRKQGEFECF